MSGWIIATFWVVGSGLGALGAALLWRGLFADRSRGRRRCPACWYDMSGAGLLCTECGREHRSEARLRRTRRHWFTAAVGVLLMAGAVLCPRVPMALRDPWLVLPTPVLLLLLQVYDDEGDRVYSRTAGLAQGGAKLSGWERLLLGRACGKKVLERVRFHEAARGARGLSTYRALTASVLWGDAELRQAAYVVQTLGEGARTAVPAYAALLNHPDGGPRLYAADRLGAIGPVCEDVGAALHGALRDEREAVIRAALDGLERIGPEHPMPVANLLALLPDTRRHRLHYDAIMVIARRGEQASGAAGDLERVATSDVSGYVRIAAADAIRRVERVDRAIARLRRVLASPDFHSRLGAAQALARLNAVSELAGIAQATREGEGLLGARGTRLLASFGAPGVPYLIRLAGDERADVAVPAIGQLAVMTPMPEGAIEAMMGAVSHADPSVGLAAIQALRSLGARAAGALPSLERAAAAADADVAASARAALDELTRR